MPNRRFDLSENSSCLRLVGDVESVAAVGQRQGERTPRIGPETRKQCNSNTAGRTDDDGLNSRFLGTSSGLRQRLSLVRKLELFNIVT